MTPSEPIPPKIRAELAADPFMRRCFRSAEGTCLGRIGNPEWEHAHKYAGRRVNERWAIIPCCTFHHRGGGLDKNLNRYATLLRMTEEELDEAKRKYPRENWDQLKKWLTAKYPSFALPSVFPASLGFASPRAA